MCQSITCSCGYTNAHTTTSLLPHPGMFRGDWERERSRGNELSHKLSHTLAILHHFTQPWPLVGSTHTIVLLQLYRETLYTGNHSTFISSQVDRMSDHTTVYLPYTTHHETPLNLTQHTTLGTANTIISVQFIMWKMYV